MTIESTNVPKSETETERQRDKETERQRDRETERQRDRGTERQRDRGTEAQRDKEIERWRDRETVNVCLIFGYNENQAKRNIFQMLPFLICFPQNIYSTKISGTLTCSILRLER